MESPRRSGAEEGGDGGGERLESPEKIILRWDSTVSEEARDKMIFSGDRLEVDRYLLAVDEIQRSLQLSCISSPDSSFNPSSNTIQIAMARLEDEFRNILLSNSNPVDSESLLVDTPRSHSHTSSSEHFDHHFSSAAAAAAAAVADDEKFSSSAEVEEEEVLRYSEGSSRRGGSSSGGGGGGGSSSRLTRSIRSAASIREIDLIPHDAIADLRSIAERMIAAGYLRECIQVYGSVRKSSVDASFKNLGIEKLSIGDIQRLDWEALENKIRRWIKAAKVCIRTLFASEKRLSELIFDGLSSSFSSSSSSATSLMSLSSPSRSYSFSTSYSEACFMETVKGPAIQLFNFAEAISISRRSPEKLFKILDLHDALADLLPDIDVVFESKTAESIRVQAAEILSRLAEAARGILSEFENAVLREPSRVPVPGGTIHPLTRYVMNYISLISDYKQTLFELIVSKPSSSNSRYSGELSVPEFDFSELEEERTPLAMHLIWVIVILDCNLEGKSQHYRDTALAHLFMMNNVHYIVQKIKGSPELREMIGDEYLKKLTGRFRLAATTYQRATWIKVLHCLRDEGLHVSGSFSSGVSKSVLRERFKSFNAIFEEVHRTQATWLVPDNQLREELRISIAEKLLPAYRSFLGRFRTHIESGRHPEQYIKYSWEDLDSAVLDFFEGNPVTTHLRRRSQG